MQKTWSKEHESGFVLLETLLAIPLAAMLLTAFFTAGLWGLRSYARILSDIELHEELSTAMQRVVEDMETAQSVKISSSKGNSLLTLRSWTENGRPGEILEYGRRYDYPTGTVKLVRDRASNPLTGDHVFARITVDRFFCEELRPHCYRVVLIGRSMVSQHRYRLTTMITQEGRE